MKAQNWLNEILSSVGIVLGVDIATAQDWLGVILVGLNIIILIVSLIMKLVEWHKRAKEDGKITKEEVKEGVEIVTTALDDISKQIGASKAPQEENKNE